jgi:opacity protein-like surface antigen
LKKSLIAIMALGLILMVSSIANAQVFAKLVDESPTSWTGLYGGVHLGHGWGDMDDSLNCGNEVMLGSLSFNSFLGGSPDTFCQDGGGLGVFPPLEEPMAISALAPDDFTGEQLWRNLTDQDALNGWLGGVQLGFLYQVQKFVFGMEVSGSVTNMSDTRVTEILLDPSNLEIPGIFEFKSDINSIYTSVLRGGFAVLPNLLISAKGGLAFAQMDFESSAGWKDSNTVEGWTVGGQADIKLTKNTSAFISFDYMEFHDVKFRGGSEFLILHTTNYHEYDFDLDVVKIGLNYHFN